MTRNYLSPLKEARALMDEAIAQMDVRIIKEQLRDHIEQARNELVTIRDKGLMTNGTLNDDIERLDRILEELNC